MQYAIEISIIDDFSKQMKAIKDSIEQTNNDLRQMNEALGLLPETAEKGSKSIDGGRKRTRGWLREMLSFNRMLRQTTALFGAAFGVGQIAQFSGEMIATEQAVANTFGATGMELQKLTSDATKLATVYSTDVNEGIKTAELLTKQFGLSGAASFNLIEQALSKGVSPEFLSSIQEFGPAFQQAGFQADEMLSILAQGERLGLKEQIGSALEEATKSLGNLAGDKDAAKSLAALGFDPNQIAKALRTGSADIRQVLGQITGQLQKAGLDSEKSGKALMAIFGESGDVIKNNLSLLTETPAALSEIENRTTRASQAQQTLFTAWASFKDFIAQTVVPAFADVVEWVKANQASVLYWGSLLLKVAGAFGAIWLAAKSFTIIQSMVMTVTTAFSFLNSVLNIAKLSQLALNLAMWANPIGLVVAGIAAIGAAVYALVTYWDTVKSWLYETAVLLWNMNPLSWMINFMEYIFPGFKQAMSKVFEVITAPFKAAWNWLKNNFINPVKNAVGGILRWLGLASKKADETRDKVQSIREYTETEKKEGEAVFNKINNFKLFGDGEKQTEKTGKTTSPGSFLGAPSGQFAGVGGGISSGIAEVKGDSRQMKNITINIEKLNGIEEYVANNMQENSAKIQDMVLKAVLAAVNDANNIG